jgi:transcriptional regulator GlxA family with amidase domain
VDPNVLYVDCGRILTSAGAAAGLDLCLHLVRRDFGASVAAEAARLSVMPLERHGGQAQFIAHQPPLPEGASLDPLLKWIDGHLKAELTLVRLARQGAMSQRTLARRFAEQVGMSPAQWVLHARVRAAQRLLEKTAWPMEDVAAEIGFGSVSTFRARFRRIAGTSPIGYRTTFRPPARQ